MSLIGLTGGIASGKSLVGQQLQGLGAKLIDADQIARDVVQPGSKGWDLIVGEFGRALIDSNGGLDRKALGQLVFNDSRSLERLNRITHPLILAEIEKLLQLYCSGPERVIVLEAPLLFETGLDKFVDEVWVVTVDHRTQVKRLMERDRLTEQEAEHRIRLQLPLEEKVSRADRVIDNRGLREETARQVISEARNMMSVIGKKPEDRLGKASESLEEENPGEEDNRRSDRSPKRAPR